VVETVVNCEKWDCIFMSYEMFEEGEKIGSKREIYRLRDSTSIFQLGVGEFYKTKKFGDEN